MESKTYRAKFEVDEKTKEKFPEEELKRELISRLIDLIPIDELENHFKIEKKKFNIYGTAYYAELKI